MVSSLPTGKPYSRLDEFPLDDSSVFDTLAEAEDYAQNSPIAYHTQIIGIKSKDMAYMIAEDRSLISLGSDGGEGGMIDEEITLLGTTLGGLSEGETIPEGTTLTEFVKMITQKRVVPTYKAPALSLSGTGTKTVEAGTLLSATLTSIFTQNDAGAVTQYKVQKNGTDVHTDTALSVYSPTPTVIGDENWSFKSTAMYADGPIKADNMGDASPTGAIEAGSVSSGNVVYTGKRNAFYDADTETVAAETSAEIRALTKMTLGVGQGDDWTITVPSGSRRVTIAYPATLRDPSKVAYVEQGNAEYKDLFVKSEVAVEGADGFTAIEYKVFTYIMAVPTPATMTLTVTI